MEPSDSGKMVKVEISEEVKMPSIIELYCLRTQCPDYQNGGTLVRNRLFKTYEGALSKKSEFLDAWMNEDDYSSDDDSDEEDVEDNENEGNETSESVNDPNNDDDGKKRKRVEEEEEKLARKKARKREKYYNSGSVSKELNDGDYIECYISPFKLDLTKDFVCEI